MLLKHTKSACIAVVIAAILVLPLATAYVHAQSVTGTATIEATCGLTLNSTTFAFGILAIGEESGIDSERIEFSNAGSVNADVEVHAENWLDGGLVDHISGASTHFSQSTQGTDGEGVAYGSKIALNSTTTFIIFGVIEPSPVVNNTSWQLTATLTNLPFSGALTQDITFVGTCAP